MAAPAFLLDLVCQAARRRQGSTACSAGYPDLLVTPEQLSAILGRDAAARIPVRPDSERIIGWHGAGAWLTSVFDSRAVFEALGYTLDVIDLTAARGGEIIVDLNEPLPADFGRSYDLVLDTGTCEHCFHIGQAAMNLAALVKLDGYIVQAMPLNSYNHGFYNVNPTWVFDFYPANGFEIVYFQGVSNIVTSPRVFETPMYERFRDVPENSVLVTIARRVAATPPKVPVQRKYVSNPTLGGEPS